MVPVKDFWKQFTLALILRLLEMAWGEGEDGPFRSARVPSLFVTQILRFMEIGSGGEGGGD